MKDKFMKNGVFSLEYDKETLRDMVLELQEENKQLQDNWNKLKEWVNKHYNYYMHNDDYIGGRLCFTDMKNKMQELEGKQK